MSTEARFDSSPPGPEGGRGRRLVWIAGSVVVAAFLLASLVRLPTPSEPDEEAATTSAPSTSAPAPPSTTTPSLPRDGTTWDVPLGEVVPQFTDTIILLTWDDHGEGVMQWLSSQVAPETTKVADHDEPLWRINGLDASGRWYAVRDLGGGLTVHAVRGPAGPQPEQTSSPVAAGVRSYAWHDTEPGRLAWVACPPGATDGTLHSLDLRAGTPDPVAWRVVAGACEPPATWLADWGEWGMLMKSTGGAGGPGVEEVLLDDEGIAIATGRFAPGHPYFLAGGPDRSTVWTDDPSGPQPTSFLLSADGRRRSPVPGLLAGEWLDDAVWSPDGSALALQVQRAATVVDPMLRIVAAESGEVIAEIEEVGWVWAKAWSSDGRFFLYERWPDVAVNVAGVPRGVELVFYDTIAGARVALPLPRYATDIRVFGSAR